MRKLITSTVVALALCTAPAHAQAPKDLTGDLVKAIGDVEDKLVALANALTIEQYSWRPGEGVRSVQEVLLHVAADNYFIPAAAFNVQAPAATKITATDFAAVQAFEKQQLSKEQTIAELRTSFTHLKNALNGILADRIDAGVKLFGPWS